MAAVAANITQPLQPYQCGLCSSHFTRLENLKRHSLLHSNSSCPSPYVCRYCQQTFSRPDLRRRHTKRKHPDKEDGPSTERHHPDPQVSPKHISQGDQRQRSTSSTTLQSGIPQDLPRARTHSEQDGRYRPWEFAQSAQQHINSEHAVVGQSTTTTFDVPENAVSDDHGHYMVEDQMSLSDPTSPATRRHGSKDSGMVFSDYLGAEGHLSQHTPSDQASDRSSARQHIPDGLTSQDLPYIQDEWTPSPSQAAKGYHLYFTHVSHLVPFLHRPTFDATEVPLHLGLSLISLGYQHGEDPDCGDSAGSGAILSLLCFHRARARAAVEEETASDLPHNLALAQTYWLLSMCAVMYLGGRESAYGLKMHTRMISLARFGGLTRIPSVEPGTSEDLESLWRAFVSIESHRRTLLGIHQSDALWYQLFSIPRSLSHLEIKTDLPCPEEAWVATSAAQWAHRQLLSIPTRPMQFADAVRCFVSASPMIEALPAFDPYGAINIAQFLLSSAREVSGWSTMTGRLSLERFEPLRASLVALEPFIRPSAGAPRTAHRVTCEATWEMAMIELHMWSVSHTCGIIDGSVDSMLNQSTLLALSCETTFEKDTATAVQPHIDWFLQYLETAEPEFEPPWVALYAYKVFLLAWQMVGNGTSGAMQVVGVADGDKTAALDWAAKVYGRRKNGLMGKSALVSLQILDQ